MEDNKKFILMAAGLLVLIIVLMIILLKPVNNDNKGETGYFFTQAKSFSDIKMIDIKYGDNNITISPVNELINYYSYDKEGMESPVDEIRGNSSKEQQDYIMNKVIPNLKDKSCTNNSKWCVLINVTGGGAAASGNTNPPDWFKKLLDVYNYNKYFNK
jgi:hypothetical protein